MASWLYFSLVLKVISGSPSLDIQFERTGVKILWLNSFNFAWFRNTFWSLLRLLPEIYSPHHCHGSILGLKSLELTRWRHETTWRLRYPKPLKDCTGTQCSVVNLQCDVTDIETEAGFKRLHQCWWRMLETKCVGDNFEMLVTVLAVFVTIILYLLTLTSGTNNQKMSPISKFCHSHPKIVT